MPNQLEAQEQKGTVYALLVGVNVYEDKSWNKLKYAERDVEGMYRVLTTAGKVPSGNITKLLGKNATKDAVLDKLENLSLKAGENDTLLLMFAMHGIEERKVSYLALYDTYKGDLKKTGLRSYHLMMMEFKTQRIVLLLDACDSGAPLPGEKGSRGLNRLAFPGKGKAVIASSQQTQSSWEDDELKHGWFTYAMMEALSGKADSNNDGVVTLFEAYQYVSKRVKEFVQNYNKKNKDKRYQNPVISIPAMEGEIVLSFPGKSQIPDRPDIPAERKTFVVEDAEFAVRFIPAGSFMMGSPKNAPGHQGDEELQRRVLTRPFWMMETEVTQRLFQNLMRYNPSFFSKCGLNCPVEQVNWHEACALANVLSRKQGVDECYICKGSREKVTCEVKSQYRGSAYYNCNGWRLPTEAEWEYAYRAGSRTELYNGRITEMYCKIDVNLDKIGWYCGNANRRTHPVRGKQANDWGLYDMAGNVSEWMYDWYEYDYKKLPERDPVGPNKGDAYIVRGGSYIHHARFSRAAYRSRYSPSYRSKYLGVRFLKGLTDNNR
jgi:formylglycine-generating enzyme required for sulfatase activity